MFGRTQVSSIYISTLAPFHSSLIKEGNKRCIAPWMLKYFMSEITKWQPFKEMLSSKQVIIRALISGITAMCVYGETRLQIMCSHYLVFAWIYSWISLSSWPPKEPPCQGTTSQPSIFLLHIPLPQLSYVCIRDPIYFIYVLRSKSYLLPSNPDDWVWERHYAKVRIEILYPILIWTSRIRGKAPPPSFYKLVMKCRKLLQHHI